MTDLLVLGLTPLVTALLLMGFSVFLLLGEWLLGVAQRTGWSWFGHPWTKDRARLSREGRGGALRLRGSVDGHSAAAAVAFPAGGAPHFHLGTPRRPRTMIQVQPRIPLPDGLGVQRGDGASDEDPMGLARVHTEAQEQTQQLLKDPAVCQALVTLVQDGEAAGIRDGVLFRRHPGVLDTATVDAQVDQLCEIASALSRPAEAAWSQLGTELGMGLGGGDRSGERTAIGRIQGGLSVRIQVLTDESTGEWQTRLRVGLAPGAPAGITLSPAGQDISNPFALAPDHALAGRVSCGAEDASALAMRLERPDVCAGIEELILGWPDTRVADGYVEARIPGWSWHDLQDRVLSMGVLARLLAGELPEHLTRR